MSEARFRRLLKQLEGESFEDGRTELLEMAAKRNHFTSAQLGRVVAKLRFAEERVGAVRILPRRLVDLDNAHEVLERFTFSESRLAVVWILGSD